MIYAFLTEGLDGEHKEKFDLALEGEGAQTVEKAKRERAAVEQAMRFMR